jgi:predicted extracellular nuclease
VNNHFSSKTGSAPIFGIAQPFEALQDDPLVNGAVDFRRAQALAVKEFAEVQLSNNKDARLVVLGDFNEFEFVSPLYEILGSSLANLIYDLPDDERYSYLFEGNSQSIDHIFASEKLLDEAQLQIVHVNAEFADSYARASDHDPVVARFRIQKPEPPPSPRERIEQALSDFLDRLARRSKPVSLLLGSLFKLFGFGG